MVCHLALAAAVRLVRSVRLSRWRWSLGRLEPANAGSMSGRVHAQRARLVAGAIEEAAQRMPEPPKCLPKAVAMQWLLAAMGLPSRLVIAFHATDRDSEHGYHAWVEHGDAMVMGVCDRLAYRPVLVLTQGSRSAALGRR